MGSLSATASGDDSAQSRSGMMRVTREHPRSVSAYPFFSARDPNPVCLSSLSRALRTLGFVSAAFRRARKVSVRLGDRQFPHSSKRHSSSEQVKKDHENRTPRAQNRVFA